MYPPAKFDFQRSDYYITFQEGFSDSLILNKLLLHDVSRYIFNEFSLKRIKRMTAFPVSKDVSQVT